MIASRIEFEVTIGRMNEAIEFQKALFREGGPYHNRVKGHRIYQSYFSGQGNILATEMLFESLTDFESSHHEMFTQISEGDWKAYHELFDRNYTWHHWTIEDEG